MILNKLFAAGATDPNAANCNLNNGPIPASCTGLSPVAANSGVLHTVLQTVFGIIGVVAVVFIVIGGLQYITSQGNADNTNKARNTIIYALVGLVIALSAEILVSFVLNKASGI